MDEVTILKRNISNGQINEYPAMGKLAIFQTF